MTHLTIGTKVRLIHDVDRYPHFIAPEGATGTVVDIGDPMIFAVKLDAHIDGAEDWSNEIHWSNDDLGAPMSEVQEERLEAIEIALQHLDHYVKLDAIRQSTQTVLENDQKQGGPAGVLDAIALELERRAILHAPAIDGALEVLS